MNIFCLFGHKRIEFWGKSVTHYAPINISNDDLSVNIEVCKRCGAVFTQVTKLKNDKVSNAAAGSPGEIKFQGV